MPQTPENLQINVNPNYNAQAPQVDLTVVKPTIVAEGEVSSPTPDQWIGPINYGMNWYALGAAGFKVAGNIYENVLDYNVQKKVGQINDLQFDLETKMRNSYSESLTKPENSSAIPTVNNYSQPFEKSDKFQQEYIDQTNEILGIGSRDESGKYIDVFQPEYNLDGLGTKYIQAVTMARAGLQNIAATSEKVQSDLLKIHQQNYNISSLITKNQNGEFLTEKEQNDITPSYYPFTMQKTPLPFPVSFDPQKNITEKGEPVILNSPDNKLQIINPNATSTELLNTLGENQFTLVTALESNAQGSNRGPGVLSSISKNVHLTIQSSTASPAQIIQLSELLKSIPEEKVKQLQKSGIDYTATESAKLWRAYSLANSPEPITTVEFRDELNKITTPTATSVMNILSTLRGATPAPDNINTTRTYSNRLDTAKTVYRIMLDKVGEEDDADRDARVENIIEDLNKNPGLMPAMINNLIMYESIYAGNPDNEDTAKKAVTSSGDSIIKDSYGSLYLPRVPGIANQLTSIQSTVTTMDGQLNKKTDRLSFDPTFKEKIKLDQMSSQQLAWRFGSLQSNVSPNQISLFVDAVDNSGFVKSNSPLKTETRMGLIKSLRAISTDGIANVSTPITQAELLRLTIATNPAVIKKFNYNVEPKTEEIAIVAASKAYDTMGPAEYWSWSDTHTSGKDAFVNSTNGGISFDLSGITYIDSRTGQESNLVSDPFVVSPSSAGKLQFTHQVTGNPLSFISNLSLRSAEFENEVISNYKNSKLYGKSKKTEVNTGSNVVTSDKDVGLQAALSHMSATTPEDYMNINQDIILYLDTQTVSLLTNEITPQQASDAISDPAFLNEVSVSLNNTYGIPQDIANKILYNVVQNKDLKNMIVTKDVNEDGKLNKIDLFSSLHNAVIGYKQNKLEKKPMEIQNEADVYWSGSRSMLGPDGNIGLDFRSQDSGVYGSGTYSTNNQSPLMDEFKKRQALKYKVNLGLIPQNNFQPSGDPNINSTQTSTPIVTPNIDTGLSMDTNWGSYKTKTERELEWSNSEEGKEILNTFWSNILKPNDSEALPEMDMRAELEAGIRKAKIKEANKEQNQNSFLTDKNPNAPKVSPGSVSGNAEDKMNKIIAEDNITNMTPTQSKKWKEEQQILKLQDERDTESKAELLKMFDNKSKFQEFVNTYIKPTIKNLNDATVDGELARSISQQELLMLNPDTESKISKIFSFRNQMIDFFHLDKPQQFDNKVKLDTKDSLNIAEILYKNKTLNKEEYTTIKKELLRKQQQRNNEVEDQRKNSDKLV